MGHPSNGIFSLIFPGMNFRGLQRDCFGKGLGVKEYKKNNAELTPGIAKKNQYIKKVEAYKNQFYKFVLISLVWFVLSLFCKLLM